MAIAPVRMHNGPSFTRDEKLRVRTLYLVKGWTPAEIAEKLEKEPRQISNLANKMGWTKRRREIEEKAAARAEALATVDAKDFVESVAIRGEEMTHRGFELAETAADSKDALAFSAAMSGTKTAVALTRQALGVDAVQSAAATINICFARPETANAEPRPVEKVGPDAIEQGACAEDLEFA